MKNDSCRFNHDAQACKNASKEQKKEAAQWVQSDQAKACKERQKQPKAKAKGKGK